MRLNSPKSIVNARQFRDRVDKSWAELAPPSLMKVVSHDEDEAASQASASAARNEPTTAS